MEQTKIKRILRFMLLLTSNVDYTTPEIAHRLDINVRSAYRYLRSFKDEGFPMVKRGCNVYKLMSMPVRKIRLDRLIHLSQEEAHILHTLLVSLSGESQVHINLEKIQTTQSYTPSVMPRYTGGGGSTSAALPEVPELRPMPKLD